MGLFLSQQIHQVFLVLAEVEGGIGMNLALFDQVGKTDIQGRELFRTHQLGANFMRLALTDHVGHPVAVGELLIRGNPAFVVFGFQQPLIEGEQQVVGQLHADLLLVLGGEDINDPVDGKGGVICMQGA